MSEIGTSKCGASNTDRDVCRPCALATWVRGTLVIPSAVWWLWLARTTAACEAAWCLCDNTPVDSGEQFRQADEIASGTGAGADDWERALSAMRDAGLEANWAVHVTRQRLGLSPSEAYRLVVFSETWRDHRDTMTAAQNDFVFVLAMEDADFPTLVTPTKPDIERDAVAAIWEKAGADVLRLDRFWEPPDLDPRTVRLYGPATFCWVVADVIGVRLLGPPDDLLLSLEPEELGREVVGVTLGAALDGRFPRFVKPVVPKQFTAAVYRSSAELAEATEGLDLDDMVMSSEVASFDAEARLFVDACSHVEARSVFEGNGDVWAASARGSDIAQRLNLDVPYVMDLGLLRGEWVVVEFNEAWGSGLNGCRASDVAYVLLESVVPE